MWTCGGAAPLAATDFVWATPNAAAVESRPYVDFVQPTESGLPESGMFGCVRSSGAQFHEGLDLSPVQRDRRGDPTDEVFSIAPGVVRHLNATPGLSTYGRYVVVEHADPGLPFVSLYAHLAKIAPGLPAGARVTAGQSLGIMGNSATYTIPRDRAHLHLEVGFRLSDGFQRWYDAQKYPDRNDHGVFNGRNVVGLDFLDFIERRRAGQVPNLLTYVRRLPTAVTVIARQTRVPDFVTRHPALLETALPPEGIGGWRIDFTWFGLPKAWRPLTRAEAAAVSGDSPYEVAFHDTALLARFPCQSAVRINGGRAFVGARLTDALDILFTAP